jgi:hypothetical protein
MYVVNVVCSCITVRRPMLSVQIYEAGSVQSWYGIEHSCHRFKGTETMTCKLRAISEMITPAKSLK